MDDEIKFSDLAGPEKLIGSRVLEFELSSVLGAGGMSVVYRARHRVTGQEVAIKVLPPELAVHDELKDRFVEEARVLARLEHPNIVSLNNFCEAGGRLCLIMQFVDGVTFESQILGAGRLPWREVLRVGVEVLKALEYAHGQKVVHRDIKPSNVLVKPDGGVKVTDFGIARILGNTRLTSTGQTMGTVRYMSPEQVRGKPVDSRSDVYSLGVTLYEALAGRTPFDGDNQFDIMQQHLNRKPPSLASLGAKVPSEVEKALLVSMAKPIPERYQTATEFRQALEAALVGETPSLPDRARSGGGQGRRIALALGATVAVAGGTALAILVGHGSGVGAGHGPAPSPAPAALPRKPAFLEPRVLPGVRLAVDKTYAAEGVRVQSSSQRDPAALRDAYRAVVGTLREFEALSELPDVRKAAASQPAPLTIVVVPQAILDKQALWPDFPMKPDVSYPSRYVPTRRTLFVADEPGFEKGELPYGVALHAFAPIASLSQEGILSLAEKFEAYYASRAAR